MISFTVLNGHGEVVAKGVSFARAATEVIRHDGHDFEIWAEDDGDCFYVTQFSRNSALGGSPMVK